MKLKKGKKKKRKVEVRSLNGKNTNVAQKIEETVVYDEYEEDSEAIIWTPPESGLPPRITEIVYISSFFKFYLYSYNLNSLNFLSKQCLGIVVNVASLEFTQKRIAIFYLI